MKKRVLLIGNNASVQLAAALAMKNTSGLVRQLEKGSAPAPVVVRDEIHTIDIAGVERRVAVSYSAGRDFHTATAATVFGVPLDKVTKQQRAFAKGLNLRACYLPAIPKEEIPRPCEQQHAYESGLMDAHMGVRLRDISAATIQAHSGWQGESVVCYLNGVADGVL